MGYEMGFGIWNMGWDLGFGIWVGWDFNGWDMGVWDWDMTPMGGKYNRATIRFVMMRRI
jgi:hypothetical protein